MRVLVTRPTPAGEQLVTRLVGLDIMAFHAPLIDFSPGKDLHNLPEHLNSLNSGDLLFALSPRALNYALPLIQKSRFVWPQQLSYFAIGRTTALALHSVCQHNVEYPLGREVSEELLRLPALSHIEGKRALLLRGNGGRELLAETLQTRGAEVTLCECYQRNPIEYHGRTQAAHWMNLGVDTLVVTSGEMLQQLYHLVPDDYHHWLLTCRLIVVSERLATLAKERGWNTITVADNADNDALIRALR